MHHSAIPFVLADQTNTLAQRAGSFSPARSSDVAPFNPPHASELAVCTSEVATMRRRVVAELDDARRAQLAQVVRVCDFEN